MTNRELGAEFEREFCEKLSHAGYWVHNFAQNQAGQPADVIAVRDRRSYLIDCKVCSLDAFPLSRIEENQHLAMEHWNKCGNGYGWFAFKFYDGQILMMSYIDIAYMVESKQAAIKPNDFIAFGVKLEEWVWRDKNSASWWC